MGRRRVHESGLPIRLFEWHSSYRYAFRADGEARWLQLGRDRVEAIAMAEELNRMKRAERARVLSSYYRIADDVRALVFDRDGFKCF